MRALLFLGLLIGCDDGNAPGSTPAEDGRVPRDCGVGEVHSEGACRAVEGFCQRNGDCSEGLSCDRETRRCVADEDERSCASEADCFAGEACLEHRCGPRPDAGPDAAPDARLDAAIDAATDPDAVVDAVVDAAVPDAVVPDAVVPDAGRPDTKLPDARPVDAEPDARPVDAEPHPVDAEPDQAVDAEPDRAILLVDAAVDAEPDADLDAELDLAVDAAPDLPIDAEPDLAADLPVDAFTVPPTPDPGLYEWTRLPIAVAEDHERVRFHPAGDYFVVLSRRDGVHLIDWATLAVRRLDLRAGNRSVYWTDLEFHPSGSHALLVGYRQGNGEQARDGLVFRLDDAAYRAGEEVILQELDAGQAGIPIHAIEYPPEGGDPLVLSTEDTAGPGYIARLRALDEESGAYGDFIVATATGAGCDDLGFAFDGFREWGRVVACGQNGAEIWLHTDLAGWARNPGNNNLGNTSSVAGHPSGEYALLISTSGRRLHRFGLGLIGRDPPWFSRIGIFRVVFQQEGQRALIVGRTAVQPTRGTALEYRHDLYRCPAPGRDCDVADVSIPGFDGAPWNGDGNDYLKDAAFKPGCDGGIVVGGRSSINGQVGYIARFAILNGRACEP